MEVQLFSAANTTMSGFYLKKYNQQNDLLVLKSLIYFDDVQESEWPIMTKEPDLKWKDVKRKIQKKVIDYSRQETAHRTPHAGH